ncbi:MAG: Neisseria PilC protein [Acidobacteriota bacterium]|nr:Neisseria PilC protein [Acidobacteriota bacterium]
MKIKQAIKLIMIVFVLLVAGLNVEPDDKELFMGVNIGTTLVKANVMIMMDNSGSMNTIVFYPKNGPDGFVGPNPPPSGPNDDGYNPNTAYSGTVDGFTGETKLSETGWHARWIVSTTSAKEYTTTDLENYGGTGKNFWTGCYAGGGTDFQVGSNGTQWFYVGDTVIFCDTASPTNDAVAKITAKYTDGSGNTWFTLSNIVGGPITVNGGHFQKTPTGKTWTARIVQLYGTLDHGQQVRYPQNYSNWLYFKATDTMRTVVSHFSTYGTFDVSQTPGPALSSCATTGNDDLGGASPRLRRVFTRIQTAREVVCQVASNSNNIVRLGLFNFTTDNGGILNTDLSDMSDEAVGGPARLEDYKDNAYSAYGSTWTPLAETLADIWKYYKPGGSNKKYWPVDYEIANNLVTHSVSDPGSPIEYWCQNNYVVIMTDGESTKDGFNDSDTWSDSIFKQKPCKRTSPWTSWNNGWGDSDNNDASSGRPTNYKTTNAYCPNYSCWSASDGGTDYLDDVAYFIRHQDMFPDSFFGTDPSDGWPGEQNIYTYAIGFNVDNHMLQQTAINGDGAYYTANNFDELVDAFQTVITSINLRNYAFSSITAPKKSTTATDDEMTYSYVGYFMPSQTASVWEGHLLAFKLLDLWGFDSDESGDVGPEEYIYDNEEQCASSSGGLPCQRWVYLNIGHEWDAADKLPTTRSLYTSSSTALTTNIPFNISNISTLKPLFVLSGDAATQTTNATQIINTITQRKLGDIFHSDVSFVGPPPAGKKYLPNIDPPGSSDEKFATFYEAHKNRSKVIYAGTNDGIMHMFYASGVNAGKEAWGFIPDEVLPTFKRIVLDGKHTYTVDGRITPEDVYFKKSGLNKWATLLCFGLRGGGEAYYALDISSVGSTPTVLWKYKNNDWSGESWGEPVVSRIMINNPDASGQTMQKWVVFLTGGFAFTSENPNNKKGKAIFMVDAGTGELLWMLGYDSTISYTGTAPAEGILKTAESGDTMLLTKEAEFNFPIPSALTAVDKDSNGFTDSLYFGNMGGHFFKVDITNSDPLQWTTSILFQTAISDKASSTISSIDAVDPGKITLTADAADIGFDVGDTILGKTSYATGYIEKINDSLITVSLNSGTFQASERVVARTYNPIYLSPAVAYDRCYTPWVCFGTGDRDRPRTNSAAGAFVIFKDNGILLHKIDNEYTTGLNETSQLLDVSSLWDDNSLPQSTLDTENNGWYFKYPAAAEKIFDPDPLILPDQYYNPHIYFNTYQPPSISSTTLDNPCAAPNEGTMTFYELSIGCGVSNDITGSNHMGRIAGGGIYGGKEYIMYEGTDGNVASVPGGDSGEDSNLSTHAKSLDYPGGVVFWLEKKK